MLVDCPDCARSYQLDAAEIGESGRVLICPRCDARWFCIGGRSAQDGFRFEFDPARAERRVGPPTGAVAWSFPPLDGLLRPLLATFLVVAVATGLVCARRAIVRFVPRTAPLFAAAHLPVNVSGFEIGRLLPTQLPSADLTVSGQIRNVAHHRLSLPRIAFEVRDAAGQPLLTWSENPPARSLGAGQIAAFASMPHSVPPGSRTVLVRLEAENGSPVRMAGR